MASAPQTWTVLSNIQATIQTEVRVGGVSPFTAFSTADASAYGATNAIYIGPPKDLKSAYTTQCWIIPPNPDHPYREGLGGKVWQEQNIQVILLTDYTTNYYAAMQTLANVVDATVPVLMRHVDANWGSTVAAARIAAGSAMYGFLESIGKDWFTWHCMLWIKQEWNVAGGFVP